MDFYYYHTYRNRKDYLNEKTQKKTHTHFPADLKQLFGVSVEYKFFYYQHIIQNIGLSLQGKILESTFTWIIASLGRNSGIMKKV